LRSVANKLLKAIRNILLKETLINCLCGMKRKAHGAQEPRHIQGYVEVTNPDIKYPDLHRASFCGGDSPAQAINQCFLKYFLKLNIHQYK